MTLRREYLEPYGRGVINWMCKNCRDTGYYMDNNGHGQLTWKRACPCKGRRDQRAPAFACDSCGGTFPFVENWDAEPEARELCDDCFNESVARDI